MDRVSKILSRLTPKERNLVEEILNRIMDGHLTGLDIKRLKGYKDIFRARIGKIRIIYHQKDSNFSIIRIERRSQSTYKNLR